MARARDLRARTRTHIDDLRDNLTELERSLPTIEGMGEKALGLLHRLDTVYYDMSRFQEEEIDLRAEQARLESVHTRLRSDRASVLVKEVASTVGWEAARASVAPEDHRWWWYLDEELTRRRRSKLRSWLLRGGIMAVIVASLAVAYQLFLAPSPETEQKVSLMQRAEQYQATGDLTQAIASYEEAAGIDPKDPEIQLWLGVLYGQVGQRQASIEAFRSARQSSPSIFDYFFLRSRIYLQMGLLDKAARDTMTALEIDPHSKQALFLLADLLEQQQNYREALDTFYRVSLEAEDPALQVLARIRYGMLLQSAPSMEMGAITPTAPVIGQ